MGLQYLTDRPELSRDRGKIKVRQQYLSELMLLYCKHWVEWIEILR